MNRKTDVPIIVNVPAAQPVIQVAPPPVRSEIDYSGAITAWATVALVLATGVLAFLTWVLAQATRRASVVVTIEPNPAAINFVDIHIVNEGNVAAYDVNIEFVPPLPTAGGQFTEIKFPSKFVILAAGQRLISSLCEAFVIMDNKYLLNVSWRTNPKSRTRRSLSYNLDISHLRMVSRLGKEPEIQTADEIKKIREYIEKIASGRARIQVDGFSQSDRDDERQERLAWYAEQQGNDSNDDAAQKSDALHGFISRFKSRLLRFFSRR